MFISNNAWNQTLNQIPHDIYHRAEYVEADALSVNQDASPLLYLNNHFAIPLVARSINSDFWDATSPYGYGSPLSLDTPSSNTASKCFQDVIDEFANAGCVSLFVRMHPFLDSSIESSSVVTFDEPAATTWMDLKVNENERLLTLRRDHRRAVRLAREFGVKIHKDLNFRYLDEFIFYYSETMNRLGAQSRYYFSREYFLRILIGLAPNASLFVATVNSEFAAGAIISNVGTVSQYHLSATNTRFLDTHAMKLLLFEAANDLSRNGLEVFHLGGGLGGSDDSLFKFKAGFSDSRASFQTARIICNPDEYNRLVSERPNDAPDTSFFPEYRAPM